MNKIMKINSINFGLCKNQRANICTESGNMTSLLVLWTDAGKFSRSKKSSGQLIVTKNRDAQIYRIIPLSRKIYIRQNDRRSMTSRFAFVKNMKNKGDEITSKELGMEIQSSRDFLPFFLFHLEISKKSELEFQFHRT